jgi:peptidoglycan/xylan/chitin deacetylase (PgdA/CDA1 family)
VRISGRSLIKPAARAALRLPSVSAAFRRLAALRRRGLVLVYHRITRDDPPHPLLVPTIPLHTFRRQVEVLGELGRIVGLPELLQDADGGRTPRFALTFDDDYLSHIEHVLPVLRGLSLPGTFFLSGRALHGAGPLWFESLQRLIAVRGLDRVETLLGMTGAGSQALLLACEEDPALQQVIEREPAEGAKQLAAEHIRALVKAEMTIGFHTLHHPVLTRLGDRELRSALVDGRDELAEVVGQPLLLFAYPHGKADRRTAGMVREAGYVAAWTGQPRPMHRREDPYLLGRWEPGALEVDEFSTAITIRLNHGGPGP